MNCLRCDGPILKGQYVMPCEQVTWVGRGAAELTMHRTLVHLTCPPTQRQMDVVKRALTGERD